MRPLSEKQTKSKMTETQQRKRREGGKERRKRGDKCPAFRTIRELL
jgi:hypothetical protein